MNIKRHIINESISYFEQVFFEKINNISKLTSIEEEKLIEEMLLGDKEARKQLIESKLDLVVKLAKKYEGNDVELFDLIQVGNIAVINVLDTIKFFEKDTYYRYSYMAIKNQMQQLIKNEIKNSHFGKGSECDKLVFFSTKDTTFETVLEITLKENIQKVLNTLLPEEKKILEMRFGLNGFEKHTLKEIGKELEVTRELIRQTEAKALRKLRDPNSSIFIDLFL